MHTEAVQFITLLYAIHNLNYGPTNISFFTPSKKQFDHNALFIIYIYFTFIVFFVQYVCLSCSIDTSSIFANK